MNLVIQQHKDLQQAVEAKQLYTELGLDKSNWAKWSQRNITNNEFALEYADYVGFVQTTNGNSTQNFLLSIPFAKKLAMQVKTQKGEDVRNYFDDICCHEVIRTDNKAKIHIIDPQDEHYHDEADSHVFMLNGLLMAKDVAMPKAGV